jgi:hypothetical protein
VSAISSPAEGGGKAGAKLKLLIPQGRVRHVLDAMLTSPRLRGFDDEAAAVASFQTDATPN